MNNISNINLLIERDQLLRENNSLQMELTKLAGRLKRLEEQWNTLCQQHLKAAEKPRQIEKAAKEATVTVPHALKIIGPPQFVRSVNQVLTQLQCYAPDRYVEAILYLPKVQLVCLCKEHDFAANSSGLFTIDGSGDNSLQKNTFDWFKSVYFHEVGHNVRGRQEHNWSELAANQYSEMVQAEVNMMQERIKKIRELRGL